MTPTLVRFEIGSSRLIRCGMTTYWSINRVISLLIACGAGRFVRPEVLPTISTHMISAQKNKVPKVPLFHRSELHDVLLVNFESRYKSFRHVQN